VLAFVSKPGFDPNLFVDGIDPASWSELNNSPDRPLTNRAINGIYPPGSTFKPFMAMAALELGKRTPKSAINDPGLFRVRRQALPRLQARRPRPRRPLQVDRGVLRHVLLPARQRHGHRGDRGFMGKFGFGSKSGIDLEGESIGVLPSPEWKQKRFRKPEQQKWYAGETVSIGIGQGYNAYTPIQIAVALATLAADGDMYRPRLVSHIDNLRTGERRQMEPALIRHIPLKPENVEFVKRAMAGVNKEGTGARSFANAQYTNGGKTGTAQVSRHEAEREVRREEGSRAPPRPFPVRRLRAAREPEDRAVRDRGERRLRARAPRRRSRAPCSTTTCSARCPKRRARRETRRGREEEEEAD
jgi:penicillin-binding protein 2